MTARRDRPHECDGFGVPVEECSDPPDAPAARGTCYLHDGQVYAVTHTLEIILRIVLLCIEALLAPALAYLLLLSMGALVASRRQPRARIQRPPDADLPRFALLIPAHDEELVMSGLLESATALDYPADRRATVVVADNCTDETAALARMGGAEVYERTSAGQRAKGYALRWLLEQLDAEGRRFDAYVIVDADSRLAPDFLRQMAAALEAGAQVIQAQYRVLNDGDAWTAGLRAVAFALFNHLRPLGRSAFGWSAGLKGNGMCFRREVFERVGWDAYALAEDAEYHLRLLDAGIHVVYAPAALVAAEMPTTLHQARSQQARWERGRQELARTHLGRLVRGFLRTGDIARLDTAMELLLPPLSLMVGAVTLTLALAMSLRWAPGIWLALALTLALALHVFIGASLARLSLRAYLALLRAPLYIAWKCWVYLAALATRGDGPWVRTERTNTR